MNKVATVSMCLKICKESRLLGMYVMYVNVEINCVVGKWLNTRHII